MNECIYLSFTARLGLKSLRYQQSVWIKFQNYTFSVDFYVIIIIFFTEKLSGTGIVHLLHTLCYSFKFINLTLQETHV